ncbi:hypothetical protein OT109_12400 [Phycisphaeraceae bacterium D3-23]
MMQTRKCGACGYDLMGIAATGRCPECGRTYDVATGHGTDARRKPWLERYFRTMACLAFAVFVLGCAGVFSLASSRPMGVIVGGLAVVGVALLAALYNFQSERQDAKAEDEANR